MAQLAGLCTGGGGVWSGCQTGTELWERRRSVWRQGTHYRGDLQWLRPRLWEDTSDWDSIFTCYCERTNPEVTVVTNQSCSGDPDSVYVQFEWSVFDSELTSRLNWSEISQRETLEFRQLYLYFLTFMSLCRWLIRLSSEPAALTSPAETTGCLTVTELHRAVRRLAVSMLTSVDTPATQNRDVFDVVSSVHF